MISVQAFRVKGTIKCHFKNTAAVLSIVSNHLSSKDISCSQFRPLCHTDVHVIKFYKYE